MYFIWGSVALAIGVMVWLAMTDRRGRRKSVRPEADSSYLASGVADGGSTSQPRHYPGDGHNHGHFPGDGHDHGGGVESGGDAGAGGDGGGGGGGDSD
jgi:hypothetical protein